MLATFRGIDFYTFNVMSRSAVGVLSFAEHLEQQQQQQQRSRCPVTGRQTPASRMEAAFRKRRAMRPVFDQLFILRVGALLSTLVPYGATLGS